MDITLVPWIFNESTLSQSESPRGRDLVLPLGMLSIGAVLENMGMGIELVDVNLLVDDEFEYETIAQELIARQDADVYCFSTAAGVFHHTVHVSKLINDQCPDTTIILGGPHASIVDTEIMTNFPWIDIIVRGEGEETTKELFTALENDAPLIDIDGITFRQEGVIVRNDDRELISSVDDLPIPAFHLYPDDLAEKKNIDLKVAVEVGRGCPYHCTYCSTSMFWERKFRAKSPSRIVKEMQAASQIFDTDHITLRHDNFLVDRELVLDFCAEFRKADVDVTWSCSGRIDTVDPELLETMANARCTAIEFGVESGSERMQRQIKKNLSLSQLRTTIEWCNETGIRSELYFMCGFPNEKREDIEKTMEAIVDTFRISTYNTYSQLLVLYPFPETEVRRQHRELLRFYPDRTLSDTSEFYTQELLTIAKRYPAVFPELYVLENRNGIPVDEFFEIEEFMWFVFQYMMINYRWTLTILLDRLSNDFFEFFDAYTEFFEDIHRDSHRKLLDQFSDFIGYIETSKDITFPDYLSDVFEYEKACDSLKGDNRKGEPDGSTEGDTDEIRMTDSTSLESFDYDIPALVDHFIDGKIPSSVPKERTSIVLNAETNENVTTYRVGGADREILEAAKRATPIEDLHRVVTNGNGGDGASDLQKRVSRLKQLDLIAET